MEYYLNRVNQYRKELQNIQNKIEAMKRTKNEFDNEFLELLDDLDICISQIEKYSKAIERGLQ